MGTKYGPSIASGRSLPGVPRATGRLLGSVSLTDSTASENRADEAFRLVDAQLVPPRLEREELSILQEDLEQTLSTELVVRSIHPYGSAVDGTQIPRARPNDMDLLVELDPEIYAVLIHNPDGPERILRMVKRAVRRNPNYHDAEIHVDRNAVTVAVGGVHVDLVPFVPSDRTAERQMLEFPYLGEMLPTTEGRIPDTTHRKGWIETDPRLSMRYLKRLNKRHRGQIVPMIKRFKSVNERQGAILTSNHIKVIAMLDFHQHGSDRAQSPRQRTRDFASRLSTYLRGPVYDPVTNEQVDAYLSPGDRTTAMNWAQSTYRALSEADAFVAAGEPKKAEAIYKRLFTEGKGTDTS